MKAQGSNQKKQKKIVPVGQMTETTLYLGLDDKRLYRKRGERLEVMDGPGQWVEVKVSFGFLEHKKFREY